MEIRVLRYFIEIVRQGNISSAAESLHVSQPALSRQIMDLEAELGTTLFERGHRQIKLTQEGYYLYDRAQEITALVDKTEYNLQSRDVISGSLDIGAGESSALQLVMTVISDLLQEYPDVQINLVSGDYNSIQRQLEAGVLEFGVIMGPHNLENYHSLVLPNSNRWGLLLRRDEPLAKKTEIRPADLIGHAIITSFQTKNGEAFRDWAGPLVNQYHFIGRYNLIYNAALLVKAGACFALTYEKLIPDDEEIVFRPLTPELVDANTLIWRRNQKLPNVGQLFLQRLNQKIKEHQK